MKHACYTFGYQGKRPEDLQTFLTKSGALLCDIRYAPFSRIALWNKSQLAKRFDSAYRHIPQLGNLNYKNGGEIEIADLDTGLALVLTLLEQRPIVLMCVCRELECCHRNLVAQKLEDVELGLIIEELEI
jgi:hypothetical protein